MKAVILNEFGGVDKLVHTELAAPQIKDDEVMVQVKAISINPVDVKTRAGKGMAGRLKDIQPLMLGWDISGIVTEVGKGVTEFEVGDEVFGMVNFPAHGKAYAEYVPAPASHLAKKPANISHEEAAAATLAALTAWQVLVDNAKIQAGQKVLIHAAAGGVGHYAVQLAKYLGAHVIGTSSAANRDFVVSLGADEHIDYRSQNFQEVVSDLDFVLDALGGDNIDRSLEVIKPNGTLISIPSGMSEGITEKAKSKNVNAYFILVQSNGQQMKILADLLEKGILKSYVYHSFPFANLGDAHLQVESGRTVGKVVVTL